MIKVKLLAYTPMPEFTVAQAAKLCYSPSTIDEIGEGLSEEKAASFINMLSDMRHESPFEHATFTFGIEGVSRALLAQLTRHRIASYSVQSQRYVNLDEFEYVVPPEIEKDEEAAKKFREAMEQARAHYISLSEILKKKHKAKFLAQGMEEKAADKAAEKLAIEDARFVLPNACETKIICTFNARSLMNLFRIRCCNRAQWEIRQLAIEMLKQVLKVAPDLFKNAGPGCVVGPCPEGKMTCGKKIEVVENFRKLKEKANEGETDSN